VQQPETIAKTDAHPASGEGFNLSMSTVVIIICIVIAGIFLIAALASSVYTISTMQMAVIERFSNYHRTEGPGFHLKLPFIETVGTVDMQVQQTTINVECKTKDNVFIKVPVSVQYQVLPEKVYDAYYKLSRPIAQIDSYVFNVLLGHIPTLSLDETFLQQNQISAAVKVELDKDMAAFGYSILKALVTDIVPDDKVKTAMNSINAAQREQEAAQATGEAKKILMVKAAEAESESKALQGQGVAKQRQAIIEGLQQSVENFTKAVPGCGSDEVLKTVLLTQYFDTLRELGASGKATTILLPNSPGAVSDFMTQLAATSQVPQNNK